MTAALIQGPLPEGGSGLYPSPIIALDPGGTTGIAVSYTGEFTGEPDDRSGLRKEYDDLADLNIRRAQIGPHHHHKELYTLLATIRPQLILCESFQYVQFKSKEWDRDSKSKVELISCEYIGVVNLFARINHTQTVFQTPSEAKKFVSDDKLKALGLYQPGKPHSNDATRHLIYWYVIRGKMRHPILTAWNKTLLNH